MSETKIIREGKTGIAITSDSGAVMFNIGASSNQFFPSVLPLYGPNDQIMPRNFANFSVIPYGDDNRYPIMIRELMDESNQVEGMTDKIVKLLIGQGPELYRKAIKDNKIIREYAIDKNITNALKSFKYEDYLLKVATDLVVMKGYYDMKLLNKGSLIGYPAKIAKIEYVPFTECRLEWPDNPNMISERIITGNFYKPWLYGFTAYPMFDNLNPFKHPISMSYNKLPQFHQEKEYNRCSFHGGINWVKNAAIVAKLLYNMNINVAAIKLNVTIPEAYWDQKETQLKEQCANSNTEFTDKLLETEMNKFIQSIIDTVAGQNNVGKMLWTKQIFDDRVGKDGELVSIKIEAIDLKIKDYITAQIEIAKRSAFETSATMQLHPALSNLTHDGNLPSGSEQLYAYKLFLNTDINIPEMIVMKSINDFIAANFPDSDLRLGFYHNAVTAEENTTSKDRIKNG